MPFITGLHVVKIVRVRLAQQFTPSSFVLHGKLREACFNIS